MGLLRCSLAASFAAITSYVGCHRLRYASPALFQVVQAVSLGKIIFRLLDCICVWLLRFLLALLLFWCLLGVAIVFFAVKVALVP